MARVAAFGSPSVLAALDDFQRKANEFAAEALVQRRVEARGEEADYPRMHRVREEAAELLEVLERRVREELTTPGATQAARRRTVSISARSHSCSSARVVTPSGVGPRLPPFGSMSGEHPVRRRRYARCRWAFEQ